MNKKKIVILLAAVLTVSQLMTGCGGQGKNEEKQSTEQTTQKEDKKQDGKSDKVASADEMAEPVDMDLDGLTPVFGSDIKDGTYTVSVDSSSSMFKIVNCELTVKDSQMTAVMTMGGTGYLKLYMGTGEEAAAASEDACIPYVENEAGEHTFTVPVEALDKGIDCAAFSKKKEKWYDRTLVFRADSLPAEALAEGTVATVESLNLEDGQYTVAVTLEGGSGKASVESPASLKVENGQAYAEIVWSSPNYDYMKLDDVKYELLDTEGNSNFMIPVSTFDWKIAVIADTVAMSEPHEIEYTLTFDSASIKKAE